MKKTFLIFFGTNNCAKELSESIPNEIYRKAHRYFAILYITEMDGSSDGKMSWHTMKSWWKKLLKSHSWQLKFIKAWHERLAVSLASTFSAVIEKNQKTFFNFWEVGELRGVSIFCLQTVEQAEADCGWVVAWYKTHRVPSYDQIGPSVWPLRCFEIIKAEPQKFGKSQFLVLGHLLNQK